ncbi:MAG: ATP-dependent DNA helicase RecG, partial [Bacteroidota bacterium]|nr:ATP-dependent DNA helicase RecG [Bacteroidota bacterium]
DLKLRGPGDLEGTQQSGIPFDLKIASLSRDVQLTEFVRNLARSLLEVDSELSSEENRVMKIQLKKRFSQPINWGVIS